jgi:hypothetical protein
VMRPLGVHAEEQRSDQQLIEPGGIGLHHCR